MRHRNIAPLALLWTAGALASLALPAQQAPPPAGTFGEQVDVAEALIDVQVTDRDGHVVLGLQPSDFRVEVARRPAEVTGAAFYSNRRFLDTTTAGELGVDPAAVPDRRLFVLFVDDQGVKSLGTPGLLVRQLDAIRELSGWLRGELQPNDLAAVVSFDSALRFHQDFTDDPEALAGAIERAGRGDAGIGTWPSRRQGSADDRLSLAAGLPQGKELARETPDMYRALTVLGRALADLPGRKNVILLSTGFGESGGPGGYRPDTRRHGDMIEALNAANAAVYAIDLMPARIRHSLQGSLTDLATSTGGDSYLEVLRFGVPLERIARETNGYYLVSVRISGGDEPGYRDVDVRVDNPEFRIRARSGLDFRSGSGPG